MTIYLDGSFTLGELGNFTFGEVNQMSVEQVRNKLNEMKKLDQSASATLELTSQIQQLCTKCRNLKYENRELKDKIFQFESNPRNRLSIGDIVSIIGTVITLLSFILGLCDKNDGASINLIQNVVYETINIENNILDIEPQNVTADGNPEQANTHTV